MISSWLMLGGLIRLLPAGPPRLGNPRLALQPPAPRESPSTATRAIGQRIRTS
jgi:hypothetical protein